MKHIRPISPMSLIGLMCLFIAIGFNLWIYRLEPTALSDPNDNTFQYALVDRTNQMWDFVGQRPISLWLTLFDHWVPNWAQGYNLPYYYSHIPQILIVASWRFLDSIRTLLVSLRGESLQASFSLFQYYHWVIYLLLSFFPLSMFLALRIIGLSWLTAGFGALIASQLSTDGLYGLDPASFLWRGWGLSSQLFSMIWLPLALAFAWRGRTIPAILTLAATTAGHLGIGIIAFLSTGVIFLSHLGHLGNVGHLKKLFFIYTGVLLLLGYWIFPILIDGNYHNISVWDGIWKFDSFGYREVLKNLFNGDLFDYGRLPILTGLVFVGLFYSLSFRPPSRNPVLGAAKWTPDQVRGDNIPQLAGFGIVFIFWLLLYFGRTTWGGLIDLIPGMSEFHLSRFIVGVHIAGLFLIPIGFDAIKNKLVVLVLLVPLVLFGVFPQTIRYSSHNDFLIKRANENYAKDAADIDSLFLHLKSYLSANPGRVFAGRGGSWGRNFRIAETPIYMHLSTYGIPTVLWLPETWSPNSDTEQYFSEGNPAHYSLYNVRYVVTPTDLAKDQIQPFWKLLESGKTWRLYSIDLSNVSDLSDVGYISSGVRPAIVSTSKTDYRSLVRLWMHSDYHTQGLYPELTFDKNYPKTTGLPNFRMLDEVTYKVPDGSTHNLFSEVPRYLSPVPSPLFPIISSQSSDSDMVFSATVEVPPNCTECIIILRQSFHPSWRVTIDGNPAQTMTVFPFYIGVSVPEGSHKIVFSYQPSGLKIFLLLISLISLTVLISRVLHLR